MNNDKRGSLRGKLINLAVDHHVVIKELQSEYFDEMMAIIAAHEAASNTQSKISEQQLVKELFTKVRAKHGSEALANLDGLIAACDIRIAQLQATNTNQAKDVV